VLDLSELYGWRPAGTEIPAGWPAGRVSRGGNLRNHRQFVTDEDALAFVGAVERFPILDSYAEKMVRLHLGRANCARDEEHRYMAFVENVRRLKELADWQGPNRALDRYLWLAGQAHAYAKNSSIVMGGEIRQLLENPPEDAKEDLVLLGARLGWMPDQPR